MSLDEITKITASICDEFGVDRLYVFGSAARGSSATSSDIDFLVEFKNPDYRLAKRFFGLLHRLEDSLNCKVDLLTISGLKNPFFRKKVLSEKVKIYEG